MVEEQDYDPRFPGGMNYLDWLMKVLSPKEQTAQTLEQIIDYIRQDRLRAESGVKAKKSDYSPKVDKLMLKIRGGPRKTIGLI
jgi:hypothetical protein